MKTRAHLIVSARGFQAQLFWRFITFCELSSVLWSSASITRFLLAIAIAIFDACYFGRRGDFDPLGRRGPCIRRIRPCLVPSHPVRRHLYRKADAGTQDRGGAHRAAAHRDALFHVRGFKGHGPFWRDFIPHDRHYPKIHAKQRLPRPLEMTAFPRFSFGACRREFPIFCSNT